MTTTLKPRVVIDTNVWISAIVFGGQPRQVTDLVADKAVTPVISTGLLTELRRKIIDKFPDYIPGLERYEKLLKHYGILVKLGSHTVNISPDPDDNMFIETALIGGCDYIISGDRHLLELKSYEGIQIVKPVAFLKIVG